MKPIEETKLIEEEKPVEEVKPMEAKTKPQEPTPEQLLKLLDMQMAELRRKREVAPASRNGVRVFSLCVIIFGAALALWVLMYMLDEMRPPKPGTPGTSGETEIEAPR